jgi:hypothetical protein
MLVVCVRFRLNVHYRLRVKARPFVSFISFGFSFHFRCFIMCVVFRFNVQ